jgi:uncharacterized DUF497 family protein
MEGDEAKSEANRLQRGFRFGVAALIFDGDTLEWEDTRKGLRRGARHRFRPGGGRCLAVVYTWRQGVRRIISARKANKGESDAYQKAFSRKK